MANLLHRNLVWRRMAPIHLTLVLNRRTETARSLLKRTRKEKSVFHEREIQLAAVVGL
jgi:hypothetical protein